MIVLRAVLRRKDVPMPHICRTTTDDLVMHCKLAADIHQLSDFKLETDNGALVSFSFRRLRNNSHGVSWWE
jgi:hypothetical protein